MSQRGAHEHAEGLGCNFQWEWHGASIYGFPDWDLDPIWLTSEGWYEERALPGSELCHSDNEYLWWIAGPDVSTVTSCTGCAFTLKVDYAENGGLEGACSFHGPTNFSDYSQRVPLAFDAHTQWSGSFWAGYPYYYRYASGTVWYGLDDGDDGYDWYLFPYSYFYARAVHNVYDGQVSAYYQYFGYLGFYGVGYTYLYTDPY